MSSVWDPTKHPHRPAGDEHGGEWAAKAIAAAPRSIENREVAGFPAGVLEEDDAVMFWPKEIGTRNGDPFWKALVDPDGTERAFWFADDNGFPHHAAVRVLNGLEDPATVELAGYGQRDVWGGANRGANNRTMSTGELDVALDLVQRHARAIAVAKDVAYARSVAASGAPTMSPEQFTADTQASTRMAEVALTNVLAEAYRRALVSVAPDVARRFKQRAQSLTAAAWDESKHPRNPGTGRDNKESPGDGGKFKSSKAGASGSDSGKEPGPKEIAAAAIEKVVKLDKPIEFEELPDEEFDTAKMLKNGKIGIHSDTGAATQATAITHEYGHYLDSRVLGNMDEWATATQELDPLYQTMKNSPTMKAVATNQIKVLDGDTQMRNYFLNGREMFARAFAQHVALVSGDPVLMKSLRSMQADKVLGFQVWQDDEFVPIQAELEKILKRKSLTAAVWDPSKHPHRPGGSPAGGEWAPTITSIVVRGKEDIDGLLDEVNDWPRLTREERNALGGSPRVYAIDGLVNAMADGNEVITLRKNGTLVGVGTFREAKDKIYGGYFAATGGSGLPLFNAFLDVAHERRKGVAFVAGNSHARKLYERVGIPNDKFRTPNDFTLTADEVRRLSEDMFALARDRKALAAAIADDEETLGWLNGVTAAVGDESATFVSPDPAELVPKAALAATIEKRTEEIRQQVVNVVAGGVLARAGISFDVGGIFSQRILDKVGARVRDADLSTRDAIRTVINEAQAKGWTVPETAGAIKAHILELSDSTALQLARTDLIGTANASAIAAARMVFAGQQVTKQWLATEDERTRPTHADADGQVVPLDAAFLVGNSRLDYPGDPDGPDAEVCNCRCTILFDTERAITAASVWDSLVAAFNPTLHPHEPGGSPVGGRWARKGTPWTGPDLSPDPGYLSEVEESWYDDSGAQPDIVAIRHEMSMDDYQRETATRLREWLEPTYVATRIPSDLLDDVAESGRLKSQFETNRSGGTLNPSFRAYAEERMFGYDRELDPTARPIYGYVNKPGVGAGNVWFYGDAELELKPTVRARTTITDGDSLNVNRIPSAIDNPSHLSTAAPVAYTNPEMDYDPVKNGPARDPYIEAQIHGGVTLDDIAAVHLPPHLELDSATNTFPKGTPMWQSVDDRMRALKIIRDRGIPVYFDAEAR